MNAETAAPLTPLPVPPPPPPAWGPVPLDKDAAGTALGVFGLTKRYGRTNVVDGVSFTVPRRTVFGLLGPNGAGKTTLFSIVAGFLKPDRGRVTVLDVDLERVGDLRGKLSILPQDALFTPDVSVLEQMTFMCRLSGYPKADAERAARRALGMVGLTDAARKNPKNLSHGMAKRLGIAQAFVGRPQVILLDEPTAGLDPVNAKGIRDLINEFRAEATVVVSSHNLREIQEMCSHVAIMDRGRLVACDTVAALTKAGRHARLGFAKPLPAEAADRIRAVPGVSSAAPEADGRWLLTLDASARDQDEIMGEVLARLLSAGCVPRSLSEGESLENRFLELTGEIKTGDVACPACGHTLFGLSQQRCPECGRPFTFVELGRSPEALGYRGRVVDEVPRFR